MYMFVLYCLKHLISLKRYTSISKRANISSFKTYEIKDNYIQNLDGSFSLVLHINPPYLSLKGEMDMEMFSVSLARVLNRLDALDELKIIKLETYIDLKSNMQAEKERVNGLFNAKDNGSITETELNSRLDVIEARFNELINTQERGEKTKSFYILLTSSTKESVLDLATFTLDSFLDTGVRGEILNKESLEEFVSLYNEDMLGDTIRFNLRSYKVGEKERTILNIKEYPIEVQDGWCRDIMDIENSKVILSFKKADVQDVLKKIDSTLLTLNSDTYSEKASKVVQRENQKETLENMLSSLSQGLDGAISTNIYVFVDTKSSKAIKRYLNKDGFVFQENIAKVKDNYLINLLGNIEGKENRRIMPCSVAGASYPSDNNLIQDPKGIEIGDKIYKDFFILDENHLNSNMVILGKSGAGKSYFSKSLITNFASLDTKIFILDPEGEYKTITKNLGGEIIDTSYGDNGRINPFETIQDEDITHHLRFLDEMYKTVFIGLSQDALNILNDETAKMYKDMKDTPSFQDLFKRINNRLNEEKDINQIGILKTLLTHMSAMLNGLAGKLWNGETNINTKVKVLDIDFSKLLLDRNHEITNAEMLIVLHYVMGQLALNTTQKSKVIVVIDEAHMFVDGVYSAALDFMYQLAKRIRKYNGMQIVITQNIKDFTGSQEIIKKTSAVINASQYSVLFSLSPQDITDVLKLYENAGGFSEIERNLLTYEGRGEALMILSNKERICIKVNTLKEIKNISDLS